MITPREFIRSSVRLAKGIAVVGAPLAALTMQGARSQPVRVRPGKPKTRWVFLVDTQNCIGCGLCVEACKRENDIPMKANVSRTWIERYVLSKSGELHADTPNAGREGYTNSEVDLGRGNFFKIDPAEIQKAFFVPKLCNQCENPPCVQVCPVGATYQTSDGVVLVDHKTCIGCGYCIMACPYGSRFFHPKAKVADKCTFCYHRITRGMKPACEEVCPTKARRIGNIQDPDDPVTKVIMTERVGVLKDDYGTKPQVYYLGLSKEVS
jgi:Fe-S-cluster-containing dehydrogenase component